VTATGPEVAATILVEGRVQGVGYRAFVERQAESLGLVGYVMNRRDGRVEVHVEGKRAVIETLLKHLEDGPRLAEVLRTEVRWSQAEGRFTAFAVRYHAGEA
jgi:acylphosphatase